MLKIRATSEKTTWFAIQARLIKVYYFQLCTLLKRLETRINTVYVARFWLKYVNEW